MAQLILSASPSLPCLEVPDPDVEIMPGVKWGLCGALFSPAYWRAKTYGVDKALSVRLGRNLLEEAAACLLGGHGLPADVGVAAFRHLRDSGVLTPESTEEKIRIRLNEPLRVGSRLVRYRFVRQKSKYLADLLAAYRVSAPPQAPLELRQWLLKIPGFGPKTASWVVRNHCDSDEVAILDIHIVRACQYVGAFPADVKLPRDYASLERRFIAFARAIGVRPACLDAVIWEEMMLAGSLGRAVTLPLHDSAKRSNRPRPKAVLNPVLC